VIGIERMPCDEGVIRAAAETPGCAERAKPWVLATAILGSSLAFIDGSVVNIALPAIQADLAASVAGVQWVVNAYMLILGALMLVGGAAADRFGRRRMFATGVTIFTAASVGCGIAPSTVLLATARGLQGAGGALLVPSSLAIISSAFPAAERGRAIGTWAGFSALTTALGPMLGGWLVDVLSWRAIFFINLPVAVATLSLAFRHVPESRDEAGDGGIDWRGALLAALGLAGVAYGLTAAADLGWGNPGVAGALLAGALILAFFLYTEARVPSPMLPLGLFRSRAFSGANAITSLLYFALGGTLFFLPFDLIRVQGYSAARAGAAFLPFTLIVGMLSRWSGRLIDRYGARAPLTLGPMIAAAGFALFALPGSGGSYWRTFFPAMAVLGLGMAVTVAPLTTTVMSAVEKEHAGTASGINNATSRIATMLAVALLGTVAASVSGATLDARLADRPVSPEIRRVLEMQAAHFDEAKVPAEIRGEQRQIIKRVLEESFLRSFRVIMLIAAGLALLSAACGELTIARRRATSSGAQ
jgi:EmrB/QacA subfamily drug resistance transporter